MFDAALAALSSFAESQTLLMLAAGVVAGLAMGVLPGLGGTAAVAILLPFVVMLDPSQSLPLLIGAVSVVHHSDVITAVLLRVPGSASAAVIMPDGNAMARKGQAARALALCFVASMFGGLLGAVGLTFSIPIAEPLVLTFGSPELFMLTVLGISLAALLSQGNMLKGVIAGALGLLIGMIGAAPAAATYRFTFGSDALLDGIGLIPLALGFFGLAEIAHLVARKTAIAERIGVGGGWFAGARESLRHWRLGIRGALVGMWAGVLPGLGATAGTYMAYGQAVATAKGKDRKKFGKGDPRGLVAAESGVNSVEAGDLIPTLLFGIPGGAPAALLLGALLAYGIQPGPQMLTDHLDVMYTVVWSFAIASVIGSIICFFLVKPLARLSFVPFQYLAPALMLIMFVASFESSGQFGGLVAMLLLGVVGYLMKEADFPRAPLLIGFILSVPMERYYFLTSKLYSTGEWLTRPFVLVMLAILAVPFVLAIVRRVRTRRRPEATVSTATSTPTSVGVGTGNAGGGGNTGAAVLTGTGDGDGGRATTAGGGHGTGGGGRGTGTGGGGHGGSLDDDRVSLGPGETAESGEEEPAGMARSLWPLGLSAAMLVAFVAALFAAQSYPSKAALMPTLVSVFGVVLTAGMLAREIFAAARGKRPVRVWNRDLSRTAIAFGWLALFVVLMNFLGFVVAAAIYVPLFLLRVARLGKAATAGYVVTAVVVLVVANLYGGIDLPAGTVLPALPFIGG